MKKLYLALILFLFTLISPLSIRAEANIGGIPLTGCDGTPTGLGEIPTDPTCLTKWILGNAIILGGGIAFILSMYGGITIILAAGNPEKINEGKQIIGAALSGLLFIIFSVFLLRFIGIDILQLPEFSR